MTETTTATVPAPREEQNGSPEQGHGGRIIAALEAAWAALRAKHPDIPQVVMITGTAKQLGGERWGHFGPDFWAVPAEEIKKGRASELFIAGELIALGGRQVLKTLIHEAAHGVAYVRGIKDTSGDGNRYHNKRFVALAEELGMQGPTESVKTHGWTACTLPDATATAYSAVIAQLDAARLPYLRTPGIPGYIDDEQGQEDGETGTEDEGEKKPKKKRAGRRLAVICACEDDKGEPRRRLQLTPKSLEDGPIICGVCGKPFEPEELDEDEGDE